MDIFWLGHSSFRIKSKDVSVVTDPFDASMVGFSFPRVTADIVIISHEHGDHNNWGAVKNSTGSSPKILRGPGEYEIKGVSLRGIATWHDRVSGGERGPNTVFVIEIDGLTVAHLGDLGHKLTGEQSAEIGDIDVVLVPVGGFYTIGGETATEVVSQLEPKIIIPMHYQIPGLNPSAFGKLVDVEQFVKSIGIIPKRMSSLQLKAETLPEETELVILERKT